MTVDGVNDAIAFDMAGQYGKVAESFTIECVFKINATMPQSPEKDLCSNKEAGGFSLYVTGANLGTMAHIGGGYKSVLTPIDGNRWYHALSVWDGSTLKLYVNGRLTGEVAATGAFTIPPNTIARRFAVGADSGTNATTPVAQFAPPSSYAAANVYSAAVTAEQAVALAAQYDTAIETPTADALDVDFADGTAVDHAQALASTTRGTPVITEDPALGKPVATFDGVDDSIQYAFAPHWPMISNAVSIECTSSTTTSCPPRRRRTCARARRAAATRSTSAARASASWPTSAAATRTPSRRSPRRAAGFTSSASGRLRDAGCASTVTRSRLRRPPARSPCPNAAARGWTLGADTSPTGAPSSTLRRTSPTRVSSVARSAPMRSPRSGSPRSASSPTQASRSPRPRPPRAATLSVTEFALEIINEGNATGWSYKLDGAPIEVGQGIGAAWPRVTTWFW